MARDTLIRTYYNETKPFLTKGKLYPVTFDGPEMFVLDDSGKGQRVYYVGTKYWAWAEEKMVKVPKSMLLRAKEIIDG